MNVTVIRSIIWKEFIALLRNKRILIGMFAPLILMPLLLYGYQYFSESTSQSAATSISQILVLDELPQDLQSLIEAEESISIKHELVVDKNSTEENVDLWLSYSYDSGYHHFSLTYDSGNNSNTRAANRLIPILEAYKEQLQISYLESQSITKDILQPVSIQLSDSATERELTSHSLASIVPVILSLFALMSVINFSVELTTAEKEMATLETLFSMPAKKSQIIISKLLACIIFGSISMFMTLAAFIFVAPQFLSLNIFSLDLGWTTIITLFFTLLPLIFIGSGFSIGMGLFANSYKESGAYFTPLIFIFMLPAYIGTTPGLEISPIYSTLPILNATLLIKSVFLDNFNFIYFAVTSTVNALFSIISLTFMFKIFGAEKILFDSGSGISFKLDRRAVVSKTFLNTEDVLMSLAIIVVLFIYASTLLSPFINPLVSTLMIQLILFGLVPVGIIYYLKASPALSLGLKKPPLTGMLGGILLWLSAFSLIMIYQLVINPYIGDAPTLIELEKQILSLSPLSRFLIFALTPGVCEEILFRGFALRPLEKHLGPKWAIILTSVIFSIVHLDFLRLVPTFLLGLTFGYVTIKTRSIFPAILLHVMNNSIAIFLPNTANITFFNMIPLHLITLCIAIYCFKKTQVSKEI